MEKVSLPVKTRVVAWLMTTIGGIIGVFSLIFIVRIFTDEGQDVEFFIFSLLFGLIPFTLSIPLFLGGVFLLKRKKYALKFSLLILVIEFILLSFYLFDFISNWSLSKLYLKLTEPVFSPVFIIIFVLIIIFGLSSIFLFLDRKNFKNCIL